MDLTAKLYLTPKGEEELKRRTFKLNLKRRSLLILVDTPQIMADVLAKTILMKNECVAELEQLINENFIGIDVNLEPSAARTKQANFPDMVSINIDSFRIEEDAMLSEAKFQLTDFCVNTFGTRSQEYVERIRACKSIKETTFCLSKIVADVKDSQPNQLQVLQKLIQQINETA